jgi:pyruvate formate lyase activating enzyme
MVSKSDNTNGKAVCGICPHNCSLKPGATGICGVRKNGGNGQVVPTHYGIVSGYAFDPIEKKPLYHFFPRSVILSVGSYGCNLKCDFCQNFSISQEFSVPQGRKLLPADIVQDALKVENNTGIAFTYNEPVVWPEYMRDIAVMAKNAGLRTVMVSNGYVNPAALREMISYIDAFNIDLKFFSNESYKKYAGGTLDPVLKSISAIAEAGRHLEITTLVIPQLNDSAGEMKAITSWIASETGKDTPFHISRYFPVYRRKTERTDPSKIDELHLIASENLSFVYAGNLANTTLSDTYCPDCGTRITSRNGYITEHIGITSDGNCANCERKIYNYLTCS